MEDTDLEIYKDKRNLGKSFHKMPKCGGFKAKKYAIGEISKCEFNYISQERRVLDSLQYDNIFLELPNELFYI